MDLEHVFSKLQNHTPIILGSENFSKYAVLLPLIHKDNEIHVLFEVRSHQLRRQPGEICFPGGRIDAMDADGQSAAIRETNEELGIEKEDISNVHPLNFLFSPFGMIVYPYVGYITRPDKINPNGDEVEETFSVPLTFFINTKPKIYRVNFKADPEEDFPIENYNWRARQIEEYFYHYENRVIWGLTARILAHFIDFLY
ncbi:NUDIX hydrolase [Bacillus sp. CGMCC 1.16607]|uniref:NUDIX hydrolase n=1 Tax=Bacillus sp. CGMCC 1.16607 TaxID=3351842 RepID=UPI00363D5719